ncbi:MAG: DIP1984 family protein [Thermoleophilaceae bacterium]
MQAVIVGEALNHRSDLQKRIAQLQERLRGSVLVQEGDEPPESPDELLLELESLCGELQTLIAQLNHTNARTTLSTGETVTEGLARRDVLALRQGALRTAVRAATSDGLPFSRYSRSEIRMVRQIRVGDVQARLDALAKERRELDTLLQEHNWTTPMLE